MDIHGKLLLDPAGPPELGTLRIAPADDEAGAPARIDDIRFGERPGAAPPPEFGGRDRLIVPAFTDAHFHVPQIDSVGADGLHLLEWLERVIFPAEAWWGRGAALPAARLAARRLLTQGTAGVAAYLTSHAEGSGDALRFFAGRTRMRFHMGRSAMDRNAPDELTREDTERQRQSPTPSPLLPSLGPRAGGRAGDAPAPRQSVSANPRFAVSCTPELMAELAWAVSERDDALEAAGRPRSTFVQTHLAETRPECALIAELFPDAPHYTGVYDAAGLLGPRTLLAHGIYLSDDELALIAQRNAIIAHCPTANIFLESGLFDLDRAEAAGVRVALGSDVAGGPDVAMPRVARAMIDTAKVRKLTAPSEAAARSVRVPGPAEVWRLITEGNAALLGWPDAGRLDTGAQADLLILRVPDAWFDEHLVGRLIYNWSNELIETRIINGRPVDPDRL